MGKVDKRFTEDLPKKLERQPRIHYTASNGVKDVAYHHTD
jgi:hypothetical protein